MRSHCSLQFFNYQVHTTATVTNELLSQLEDLEFVLRQDGVLLLSAASQRVSTVLDGVSRVPN